MVPVYGRSHVYLALSISSTLGCSDDDDDVASPMCKASWASTLSDVAAMWSASRPPIRAGEAVVERGVRG